MKIAVKKNVIFNLLKTHLNENRTMNNQGGSFVHVSNLQSPSIDPFGINKLEDENMPIYPSSHVAVQLSTIAPPVDDEDYVPASHEELITASNVICREVPLGQITYYYRELHRLLDKCLDREDRYFEEESESESVSDEQDVLQEVFNITKKTSIKDFNIVKESTKPSPIIRRKGEKGKQKTSVGLTKDYEELESYQSLKSEQEKNDYASGYELGTKQGDLDIMLADGDISQEEYTSNTNSIDIIVKTGSVSFQAGFDEGKGFIESTSGMELTPVTKTVLPFPQRDQSGNNIFEKDVEYEAKSFDEYMTQQGMTEEQLNDPIVKYLIKCHLAIQEMSQSLENEYTIAMTMFYSDPDMMSKMPKEYFDSLKPTWAALNMSNQSALTNQRVKDKLKTTIKDDQKRFLKILEDVAGMKRTIIKMLSVRYEQNQQFRFETNDVAAIFNTTTERLITEIADFIAEDYAAVGSQTKYDEGDERYIRNEILKSRNIAFRLYIEELASGNIAKNIEMGVKGEELLKSIPTFNNRDDSVVTPQTIVKYVTPETFDDYKSMVLTNLDERLKQSDGSYKVFDQGIPMVYSEDQVLEIFEVMMEELLAQSEIKHSDQEELEDIDIDANDTIEKSDNSPKEMMQFLKDKLSQAERIDTDWKYMAPFYGYSGPSGLRQWTLKGPKRKFDLLDMQNTIGEESNVVLQAFESVYYRIVDSLIASMESILVTIKSDISKGKGKPTEMKKGQIATLGSQELIDYIQKGIVDLKKFSVLIDENDFGDVIKEHPEIMNSTGVSIIRNIVGGIIDKPMSSLDTDMMSEIADIIYDFADEKGIEVSEKDCEWASHYFTGLIDYPFQKVNVKDASALRKNAVKEELVFTKPEALTKVGIHTAEDYLEIEPIVKETIKGHADKFGVKKVKGKAEVIPQKYSAELKAATDKVVDILNLAAKDGASKGDQKKAIDLISGGATDTAEDTRQEEASGQAQLDILDDETLRGILDAEDIESALKIYKDMKNKK